MAIPARSLVLIASAMTVPTASWAQSLAAPPQTARLGSSPGTTTPTGTASLVELPPLQFTPAGLAPSSALPVNVANTPVLNTLRVTLVPADPATAETQSIRLRLRMLNEALPGLSARSRGTRIMNGVLSMAVGTGIGALSFLLPPGTSSTASLQPWFLTYAGLQVLSGVITVAWAPARETLSQRYENMPSSTFEERRARVMFGEHALEDMAADGMRRRYLGGAGQIAVSALTLGAMYWNPIFNATPYTLGLTDYLIIGVTGIQTVFSLIGMFTPSDEERLRSSYWNQVRSMRVDRGLSPIDVEN